MSNEFSAIREKLAFVGRRARRFLVERSLLVATAVVTTDLMIGMLIAQWTSAVIALWCCGLAAAVAIPVAIAMQGAQWARGPMALARLAEELAPQLGSAPSSAVDLARQLDGDPRFSPELARAHLRHTAERLDATDLVQRLRRRERRPRRQVGVLLIVAMVGSVVVGLVFKEGRSRLFGQLLHPGAVQWSDVPLVGDLRVTYRYPAYTGKAPHVVEGGDGTLRGVLGTEVELRGTVFSAVRSVYLRVQHAAGTEQLAMTLDGRSVAAKLTLLRDGDYRFGLITDDGTAVEERALHPMRVVPDAYPTVRLDHPTEDIELRDNQDISVLWQAGDDFGVREVALVVEPVGQKDPVRIVLEPSSDSATRREGRYLWQVGALNLPQGTEASFYLEAVDNDTVSGPKRATSARLRLTLFSARKNHERLLERERAALDALVDVLGKDLVGALEVASVQQAIVQALGDVVTLYRDLAGALADDAMTQPGMTAAFANMRDRLATMHADREAQVTRLSRRLTADVKAALTAVRARAIAQLERDIIYLDDLLAVQHIETLKNTAQDLLSAQRDLQSLLQRYRETQDPALRAELEQRIRALREEMLQLLAKMAATKEHLPGEYRNLESATMLQLDDQLQRLEKNLREGDLDRAAAELEQLADLIEGMTKSLNEAEEEYGGERYDELRKELADFAQEFRQVEDQQQGVAKRSEELLAEYRKRAIAQSGRNMEALVQEARAKVEEALRHIDALSEVSNMQGLEQSLDGARQRLLDTDALLQHQDFAEARNSIGVALDHLETLERLLGVRNADAVGGAGSARRAAQDVQDMLDKLFPEPSEVLRPDEMQRLEQLSQRQQELQQQAEQLGQRMQKLGQEMPVFGEAPRQSLESAQQEMGQAAGHLQGNKLPSGAAHARRAAGHLGKLRESLEQASQQGGGHGMPLPLGGGQQGRGGSQGHRDEKVEIPGEDARRGQPRYREKLLEAAKQQAPEDYEDAVKRYYKELIR